MVYVIITIEFLKSCGGLATKVVKPLARLRIIRERNTESVQRLFGTAAAFATGICIAGMTVISSLERPERLAGSGSPAMRAVFMALLGQCAVYAFGGVASFRGHLKQRRHVRQIRSAWGKRFLRYLRVGLSVSGMAGYAISQLLDRIGHGGHSALLSAAFILANPITVICIDAFQTIRGRRNLKSSCCAWLLPLLIGFSVVIMLLSGIGLIAYDGGGVITPPVILALASGLIQALKVIPQRLLTEAGVPNSSALFSHSTASLAVNAAALVVFVAGTGVLVDSLNEVAWELVGYGLVGALRQRLEQYAFSSPRRPSAVALMTLSAPMAQIVLSGWILQQWGGLIQTLGAILVMAAALTFIGLDELVLG